MPSLRNPHLRGVLVGIRGGLDHQPSPAQNQASHQGELITIRVLIVDGHPATRESLRAALDLGNDIVIVGDADSGEAAIERARELTPDVVFMDLGVPGIGGIEATKVIKQGSPETHVILLMDDASRPSISESIHAGASGFLLRDSAPDELVNAAWLALEGKAVIHPTLVAAYIEEVQRSGGSIESPPLSKREKEILQKVAYGATTKEVARELAVSPRTAKTILERIFEKLGGNERVPAVVARPPSARGVAERKRKPSRLNHRWRRIRWLSGPHLRRILLELSETPDEGTTSPTMRVGMRALRPIFDKSGEDALRERVEELTKGMTDGDFARLIERTKE